MRPPRVRSPAVAAVCAAVLISATACGDGRRDVREADPLPPPAPLADPLVLGPIDDPTVPLVLHVHGGGWVATGARSIDRRTVRRWQRAGVAVWSTDYRRLANSLGDVEGAYATVRARVGPERRVCLHGQSAGAQLALMVAAALAEAALVELPEGPADGPRSHHGPRTTETADRRQWRAMVRLVTDGRLPG